MGAYSTAGAFRQALEERMKTASREAGIDFQRLCRRVAFDRFLARLGRLGQRDWILKGGYAMELRFDAARSTRDLDFTIRSGDSDEVLALLQGAAGLDAGDFFTFRIGEAVADVEAAPYGGARYPVEARLAGRTFVRFHVDAGIGDVILDPIDMVPAPDWLAFAAIEPPVIPTIALEQQFAEKAHAYSVPRPIANSRVRDLVDLYLMVESGSLDAPRCVQALRRTFDRRATHDLPEELQPPPAEWDRPFRTMGDACGISVECGSAFERVSRFWSDLRNV
jgi:hypothetical protein